MSVSQIATENEVTVKDLLIAFESESNAHAKYTAYAAKADAEGLHGTASLLRATARSEEIHAKNHARLIRQLGGEPAAQIQALEVRTTLENLKEALSDEIYEVDSMYPRLLANTRGTNNSAAQTFTWALEAEKTHTGLLSEEIEKMKTGSADSSNGTALDFYVRAVCGKVSQFAEPGWCWVCNHFCGTFEIIH